MNNYLLIPTRYKVFGWILFLTSTAVYIYGTFVYPNFSENAPFQIPGFTWNYADNFRWAETNMTAPLISSGILIGLLMICFSKEKQEDEYISFLRLRSWQWAVLISYGILFFANWLLFGSWFFGFMVYNLVTILVVFIIKFNYSLYRLKQGRIGDEE
ncbi:MAG: hypothetical protein ACO1OT_00335 [Heyndrickxia sp.]